MVNIKIKVLQDILPCSLVGRMFHMNIGMCCLHLPVTRMSHVENQWSWYDSQWNVDSSLSEYRILYFKSCNLTKLISLCKLSVIFSCQSYFQIRKSFIQNLQNFRSMRFIRNSNIKICNHISQKTHSIYITSINHVILEG